MQNSSQTLSVAINEQYKVLVADNWPMGVCTEMASKKYSQN